MINCNLRLLSSWDSIHTITGHQLPRSKGNTNCQPALHVLSSMDPQIGLHCLLIAPVSVAKTARNGEKEDWLTAISLRSLWRPGWAIKGFPTYPCPRGIIGNPKYTILSSILQFLMISDWPTGSKQMLRDIGSGSADCVWSEELWSRPLHFSTLHERERERAYKEITSPGYGYQTPQTIPLSWPLKKEGPLSSSSPVTWVVAWVSLSLYRARGTAALYRTLQRAPWIRISP